MDQPDPETQLRLILKTHAADSEPLLDEVLRDAQRDALRGGMFAAALMCDQWARHAEAAVEPGAGMLRSLAKELRQGVPPEPWRSLSALREAVAFALECGVMSPAVTRLRDAYEAAHDAAPAAPTLTLEEVEEELRRQFPSFGISVTNVVGALRARLEQKGAGRGG